MKFSLTFTDLSADEARHLIAQAGGIAPVREATAPAGPATAPAAAMPPPAQPPAQPQAMPPGQPPTQPMAAPVSPAMAAAQPAPAAAPPAAAVSPKMAQVLEAMNGYSAVHQIAGVRQVLGRLGVGRLQEVTRDDHLDWLLAIFGNPQQYPPHVAAAA